MNKNENLQQELNKTEQELTELDERALELRSKVDRARNAAAKPPKYQYTQMPIDVVVENPEEYIIPELLNACKILWEKNIFTLLCSNKENYSWDEHYIELDVLSDENQAIFDELARKYPENYVYLVNSKKEKYCSIKATGISNLSESEISQIFCAAAEPFKLQDVVPYYSETKEKFMEKHAQEQEEYIRTEDGSIETVRRKRGKYRMREDGKSEVVATEEDDARVQKSFEELLKEEKKENLYDEKNGRIYDSQFFMDRHKFYEEKKHVERTIK